MKVKVLGTKCSKCKRLESKLRELVEKNNIDEFIKLEIVLVPECVGLIAYGRVVDSKPVEGTDLYDIALFL